MAIETRTLTCTCCPLGCQLTVSIEGGAIASLTGNSCPRGDAYGREEVVRPLRTVTTTVPVMGGVARRLPVRTAQPVPRQSIPKVIEALAPLCVAAPVSLGDVVLADAAHTGVNVVATADVEGVRERSEGADRAQTASH